MPTVAVAVNDYPSILTITNLVRSDVRDDMAGATGTIGEGQILVNNLTTSVTMANFFNSAVRELSRQLRLVSAPMLIADNYLLTGIPPMNGPQGLAVADPTVQVWIDNVGYFDGHGYHNQYSLPSGCFEVLRLWERQTGSNDIFHDMGEPANGMPGVYQTLGFGCWEWRQQRINLQGSLDTRDLRVRYNMLLLAQFVQNADPATTYLPILDAEEAVARKIDRMYAYRQGGTMYQMAVAEDQRATNDLLNEQVQRKQGQNYQTQAYQGGNRGPWTGFGY